jgi:hypothetical protein
MLQKQAHSFWRQTEFRVMPGLAQCLPLVIANKPYWLLSIGGVLRKQGAKHDENEACHR